MFIFVSFLKFIPINILADYFSVMLHLPFLTVQKLAFANYSLRENKKRLQTDLGFNAWHITKMIGQHKLYCTEQPIVCI